MAFVNSRTHSNDTSAWAQPVERLVVDGVPSGAVNLNVSGRELTGPIRGFGQLWRKTYQARLSGVSPREVMRAWKQNFQRFWPQGNYFYGAVEGIQPGDVAVLNLMQHRLGPPLISTGVYVIYADDESFSFMTPQGHMFAGLIKFSAFAEGEQTVAQVQAFVRANDPLYELSFRLHVGHSIEDSFWKTTLSNLAAHFHHNVNVSKAAVCLDPRLQWREARNIWQNAAIRTGLHTIRVAFRRGIRRLQKI